LNTNPPIKGQLTAARRRWTRPAASFSMASIHRFGIRKVCEPTPVDDILIMLESSWGELAALSLLKR
jgi:hypothetical protein